MHAQVGYFDRAKGSLLRCKLQAAAKMGIHISKGSCYELASALTENEC